jgi:hypothetical protein
MKRLFILILLLTSIASRGQIVQNWIDQNQDIPLNNLLFRTEFDVINISGTNYYKDLSGHAFNLKIMDKLVPYDSVQLSLDTTIQRACLKAGCIAQFYNTASVTTSNTVKTVLLIDLSQLYLDNYVFSNVTNKLFLIYSAEVTGVGLNVILDRIGSRVQKITSWGNNAAASGPVNAVLSGNDIVGVPSTTTQGLFDFNISNKSINFYGTFINVSVDANNPYYSAIVAPNGNVIAFPYNETRILDFNPTTKAVQQFGTTPPDTGLFGNNYPSTTGQGRFISTKYAGTNNSLLQMVLSDGTIFATPRTPNYGTKYNYTTNAYETFGTSFVYTTNNYATLVYIKDSLLVAIPNDQTAIININPVTKTTEAYGSLPSTTLKYSSTYKINNDLICCVPRSAANVLLIHPISKTVETFGTFTGSNLYVSSIMLDNGHILAVPMGSSATQLLEIDPIAKTTVLWGTISGSNKYTSLNKLDNGKILAFPFAASYLIEIDPAAKTITNIFNFGSTFTSKFGNTQVNIKQLSDNQVLAVPLRYNQVIDYNPISKQVYKLGYFYHATLERFSRMDNLAQIGKRIFLSKQYEQGIIDITLR